MVETKCGVEIMRDEILAAVLLGHVTQDEAMPLLDLVNGAPLLREVAPNGSEEQLLGVKPGFATKDIEGNSLVAGEVYEHSKGNKIKVLKEEFGGGNIMDTYYRIFYITQVASYSNRR